MAVCTNTEVYDFMGTPTDQRTTSRETQITALISRATEQFKQLTGRSPEAIDCSSNAHAFFNGNDCALFTHELYLGSYYRDIVSITEIKENAVLLREIVSAATQNYDYIVDAQVGKISRPWGVWLRIPACIEIKGIFGLVTHVRTGTGTQQDPYVDTYPTREDVKQIIIEMVAALSGIWRQSMVTEAGQLETTRLKITDSTQRALDSYKLRPIV